VHWAAMTTSLRPITYILELEANVITAIFKMFCKSLDIPHDAIVSVWY